MSPNEARENLMKLRLNACLEVITRHGLNAELQEEVNMRLADRKIDTAIPQIEPEPETKSVQPELTEEHLPSSYKDWVQSHDAEIR